MLEMGKAPPRLKTAEALVPLAMGLGSSMIETHSNIVVIKRSISVMSSWHRYADDKVILIKDGEVEAVQEPLDGIAS